MPRNQKQIASRMYMRIAFIRFIHHMPGLGNQDFTVSPEVHGVSETPKGLVITNTQRPNKEWLIPWTAILFVRYEVKGSEQQ